MGNPFSFLRDVARLAPVLVMLLAGWPAMAAPPPPPSDDARPRVVGYVAEWQTQYRIEDIPADRLTHVNYAFALIKDGLCAVDNADLAHANFARLRALKERHPRLKTLVSVGGWGGSPPFSDVALTPAGRERFARSCAAFAGENGFDGVDIDWEFPCGGGIDPKVGRPEDTRNFTLLLEELRRRLDERGRADHKHYLLTIATSARPKEYANLELDKIHPYLDFINVMTYDFVNGASALTGHNAPLMEGPRADAASPPPPSADDTLRDYLAAGVPADKVHIGIPFYGHAYGGVADVNHGLSQPHAANPPVKPGAPADWSYHTLAEYYVDKGPGRYWDDQAKVPWLYDPKAGLMVTYDDPESVRLKASYARDHHLGGVMFWELSQDDRQSSLLNAIHDGLGERP